MVYFRLLLLIGYLEGIDLGRGIAWRVADSMALREFLGYSLSRPICLFLIPSRSSVQLFDSLP